MRRGILLTAALVLLATSARAQPGRILVVPFENASNEPRFQWLGEACAVLLEDGLAGRGLAAIPRSDRVRAFDQLHLPGNASLSRATVIKVAELAGAAEVIVGSFSVHDSALSVKAETIRVEVGRLRPVATEQGSLAELFAIFDRLAGRLAPDTAPRPGAATRPPLGAFENYIKGLVAESAATRATFLEDAIKEYPAFDRARLGLWEVRNEQRDHGAALAAVKAITPESPFYTRARFLAGVSMLALKDYDEAFGTFKQLLEEASQHGPAQSAILNNLGVVLIRRGATPQTGTPVYFLTKATDADPNDPDYQFNLGYAYALDKNYTGAIYWLREMVRRDPADADAHLVLAAALQASGSAIEAAREKELARRLSARYEELARRGSSEPLVVPKGLERVRVDPTAGRTPTREPSLATSAQRDQRELAAFHLDRGRRLYQREQDREALDELRRAVYLSPYEAEAHLLMGRIYLRAGRPREAVNALKISIWSKDTVDARIALAEAYVKTGEPAAARQELQRALDIDPKSSEARKMLDTIR